MLSKAESPETAPPAPRPALRLKHRRWTGELLDRALHGFVLHHQSRVTMSSLVWLVPRARGAEEDPFRREGWPNRG